MPENGQFDGLMPTGENSADGESGKDTLGCCGVGQGENSPLAVTAYNQRSETGLMKRRFGLKAVIEQVVEGKEDMVPVASMPGKVQGGYGEAGAAQRVQQRLILQGRKERAWIEDDRAGTGIAPNFEKKTAAAGA